MSLSPRQIVAYLEFSDKLDRIERAISLGDTVIGTRGDEKEIRRVLKELSG